MASILVFALFSVAAMVALGTIVSSVLPYRARIACLLTHGTQTRLAALPPLPPRGARRVSPRLTESPVQLRAAA